MPQRRLPTSRDAADGGRCDHEPASDSSPVSSGAGSPTPSTVSTYGTVRGTSAGADSGRATRSSKTRSVTTLNSETPADSYMSLVGANGGGGGKRESSISLYHELATPTERPLKEFHQHLDDNFDRNIYGKERATTRDTNNQPILPTDPESNYPLDRSGDSYFGLPNSADDQPSVGKFRYVVATLIILGVTISAYASNTMYIAAIEMISNDVLQSGLTELRAKHLSNDPLALDKNAALPGTCPVEAVHRSIQVQNLVASLIPKGQLKLFNATEISAHEHLAMQQDTEELYDNVNHRIESGQLVDWSIQQRGYVFTAHTIGTILMAVPVSRLGLVYGAKAMIFMCIFLASLRMAVLPTIAGHAPFWATFVFELVIGGVGGNIIILGYPIAAAWLLPHEANFFVAINILSSMVGVAATSFVSTQLLASGLEWCWCYYIPGIMLFLLSIGWFIFGSDKPETSRFVSRAELELLQSNTIAKRNESLLRNHEQIGGSPIVTNHRDDSADETLPLVTGAKPRDSYHCRCPHRERPECPANELKRKPNWLVIFTCPTMWALILVQFANHWTAKNATLWPTFYSNILHIDSSTIGIMIGIKGVWALIFGTLFAIVTRTLVINRPFNMSLTAYRRWNQAIATTIYSTSVILIVCLDCNRLANFIALLIQPLVSSFNSISHDQMPLDLSAEDSGLLVSVIRLLSIGDIVALPVSSYILSHAPDALAGDRATWKIVWSVGLAVRALASFYFVLVAKSRPKSYSRLEPSGTCKSLSEK